MCDIGCIVNGDKKADIHELNDILNRIASRRQVETQIETILSDDCGVCIGTIGLANINQGTNAQTAVFKNNKFIFVMNGEVFNCKALSKKYNIDYNFEQGCESSLMIIDFIEKYGLEIVLKEINWEGCFIFFDRKTKELIFARDHMGIKPLYYVLKNEKIYISSEIKGLVQIECDEIKEVLPGSINVYKVQSRKLSTKMWYNINDGVGNHNLCDTLRNAVEIRVPNEPYAILLSGGVDSSIILALAQNVHKNITAYTLCTENSPDLPYARKLCKNFKIPLVEVLGESKAMLSEKISKIVDIVETWQWQVINHSAPMDILFKKIKQDGHTIVLTGEGADELFFGYEAIYSQEQQIKKEKERMSRILDLRKTNCRRLDRMSIAHGLKCRIPFLDKRIISIAMQYSYNDCVSEQNNKLPLRKFSKSILPEEFCNRPKLSLSKGAGYIYGKDHIVKNVFDYDDSSYIMKNKEYEFIARYPIEKYLLDIACKKGYLKAKYLLMAGV